MALPPTRYGLPFNITRASHLELHVANLDRSLRFCSWHVEASPFAGVGVTGSAPPDGPHVREEFLSGGGSA